MGNDSKQRFLDQVNKDNTVTLTKDDVIFGAVTEVPGGRSLTKLVAAPGSGYRGGVSLRYNRLKLGKLFGFFQPSVKIPDDVEPSPSLLIALVEERYGVPLNPDDVTISRKTVEEGDFYIVEALDTSLVFSESVEILLEYNTFEITTVIDADTDNYIYPTIQPDPDAPTKIDAVVYTGGWLVPEAAIELSAFLVGMSADKNLAWLTQTLSGDTWNLEPSEPREFNLANGLVEYNGPVSELKLVDDLAVSLLLPPAAAVNVLVVKVDETICTNVTGLMTFYY